MVVNHLERRETLEKLIPDISKYNNEFFVFDFDSTADEGDELVSDSGYSIFQVTKNMLFNLADSESDLQLGRHPNPFGYCIDYLKNEKVKRIYTLKDAKDEELDGDYCDPEDGAYYNSSYKELCDGYKEELEHAGIEVIVLKALP